VIDASFHLHSVMAPAVSGLAVGLLCGAFHFVSLRWNALIFARGRAAIAFVIQLARLALSAALFVLLAKVGAFALLAGIGGFIWARSVALGLERVRP
jgi:F1F0 ATPase subunit 2